MIECPSLWKLMKIKRPSWTFDDWMELNRIDLSSGQMNDLNGCPPDEWMVYFILTLLMMLHHGHCHDLRCIAFWLFKQCNSYGFYFKVGLKLQVTSILSWEYAVLYFIQYFHASYWASDNVTWEFDDTEFSILFVINFLFMSTESLMTPHSWFLIIILNHEYRIALCYTIPNSDWRISRCLILIPTFAWGICRSDFISYFGSFDWAL